MSQQTYTVQRYDRVTSIAKRFGTTAKTLQALSNIANHNLIMALRLRAGMAAPHPDLNKPLTRWRELCC